MPSASFVRSLRPRWHWLPLAAGMFILALSLGQFLMEAMREWPHAPSNAFGNRMFVQLLWSQVLVLASLVWRGGGRSSLWWITPSLAGMGQLLLWRALVMKKVLPATPEAFFDLAGPLGMAMCAAGAAVLFFLLLRMRVDWSLLGVVFTLFGLGLVMQARLESEINALGNQEVLASLSRRQALWFSAGLFGMCLAVKAASAKNLARLARRKYLLPVAAAVILAATWALGSEINGRRLWLSLGGFSIQSVELVKVLLVFFAAAYFSQDKPILRDAGSSASFYDSWAVLGPYAFMLGLPLLALFMQRDFGPAVLIYLFLWLMYFLATGQVFVSLAGLSAMAGVGWLGWWLKTPAVLHARVEAWLNPLTGSEQIARGLWSIAAGGTWGAGWGMGRPQTVPLSYSDYIFSSLCEETGLMGGLAVVALFGLLAWRSLDLAARVADRRMSLMAAGVGLLLTLQALLVLAGVTGLLPLMGLTLPFVSYGGSSLVVNLFMLGLLLKVADHAEQNAD